jgi:hypothetical protein
VRRELDRRFQCFEENQTWVLPGVTSSVISASIPNVAFSLGTFVSQHRVPHSSEFLDRPSLPIFGDIDTILSPLCSKPR